MSKKFLLIVLMTLVLTVVSLSKAADAAKPAKTAERYVVVEITDLDIQRGTVCKIMSVSEAKSLQRKIAEEVYVFPKAEELAKKEWEAANDVPTNKSAAAVSPMAKTIPKPFPVDMLQPRKCTERGTFGDKAEAQKILGKVQKEADAEVINRNSYKNTPIRGLRGDALTRINAENKATSNNAVRAAASLQLKIDALLQNVPGGGAASNHVTQATSLLQNQLDELVKNTRPALS